MAINKVTNKPSKSKAGLRNVIEYVLKPNKITDNLTYITGSYNKEKIDYDSVYNAFMEEKMLWQKTDGRMYAHNIISFHPEEKITPEQALDLGIEFAENWFKGFQTLVSVHQDKEHLHIHFITNTVSYEDGHKLHTTKQDLQNMKDYTNHLCQERGLTIAEKGKHFDGTQIDVGEIQSWDKNTYKLLTNNNKQSYLAECGIAVMNALENAKSKEQFIDLMQKEGWTVNWQENKKHITFVNEDGKKVRDSNILKSFNLDCTKERLEHEFERQRLQEQERTAHHRIKR